MPKTSEAQPAGHMLVRTHHRDLSLIADGAARCVIICPAAKPGWHKLAEQIAEHVRRLGAPHVPIVTDRDAEDLRFGRGQVRADLQDKTLIVLGDLNTNRIVFPLYANYYVYCDARYPGGAGFVLRTIVRPFGRQVNDLMVGGSTREGVAAGVQSLLARLNQLTPGPDVALPYCLEIKLSPELAKIFTPCLANLTQEDASSDTIAGADYALAELQRNAHLYFYTGRETFARRARRCALYLVGDNPDETFIHVTDYGLEDLAAAWRRVSVSPCLTDTERQQLDQVMYATATYQGKQWWRQKDADHGIGMRHHTTGMLGWWTLIRVLIELGQPDAAALAELTPWKSEAELYLNGLLRHYWDDADDYQSADSIQNTASYALQAGELQWFENGLARRAAQRLLAIVDNLGWYAGIQGYGEALPGWERFTLDGGLLLGSCGFIYQDGSYKWLLQRFPALQRSWGTLQPWGLHQYDSGDRLEPRQPDWFQGLQVIRFTPYRLDLINSGEFLTTDIMDSYRMTGLIARPISPELAYDKLVFRGGPDPSSQYLLLQGMSAITLSTIDMNSIIRLTDQGKLWLVHNTPQRSLYFKNAVYVSNGTNERMIPAACELSAHADFGEAALVASKLPDNRGTDWTRNIIVLRDRFTVVLDQVRANEPGEYTVCCTWRTPGFAELTQTGWESRQEDVTFFLLPGEMTGLTSKRPSQPDGATRPTMLRQNRSLSAKPGDDVNFENVLYTSGPARQQSYAIRRVAPGAVVIRCQTETPTHSIYLAAANDSGIVVPGLRSKAAVLLLGPQGAYMIGGTELIVNGERFASKEGHIAASPEFSEKIGPFLQHLWETSSPPGAKATDTTNVVTTRMPVNDMNVTNGSATDHLAGGEKVHEVSTPLWTHAGPSSTGGLIDGIRMVKVKNITGDPLLATDWILPALRAEPRLLPPTSSNLPCDSSTTGQKANKNMFHAPPVPHECRLTPLQGAEFILELPRPTRIDEIALFGDTPGETSNRLEPACLQLELTFSRDGFRHDQRSRKVTFARESTFHNLYKGHAYLFECYCAKELAEPDVTAVRVHVLAGPSSEMLLTDVQIHADGAPNHQITHIRIIDLDGDQQDEILTWTTGGDLAVLDADGAERWRKRWPEGILAIDAWDLDNDQTREVFVSRTDRHVLVLNNDGSTRWEKDFRHIQRETDERLYLDGNEVYGMAAWQPADTDQKEVLLTSYWFTAKFDTTGHVQEAFRRGGHFTQIRSVPQSLPGAGDLAIRSDIPWVGPVPLQWWHNTRNAALEPIEEEKIPANSVPNGPAIFFELADYDKNGQVEALVATEQGIGLYARHGLKTCWEHMTDAPPGGVGVVTETGSQPATIIYGREDGYLFVLTADGTLLRSTVLDEPITCLTAVRTQEGEPVIWVGTETALRCLRLDTLEPLWQQPGRYQHLDILKIGDKRRLLAVTQAGQLQAFDP